MYFCPDSKTRLKLAAKFREHIEIVHTAEYESFLHYLFPVFKEALETSTPQFQDGDEQKIRNVLLEILNRLPNSEVMGKYVEDLAELVMMVLQRDNEENAMICLRIIFEIHKVFTSKLEKQVQPFINFFTQLYTNLKPTVDLSFPEPGYIESYRLQKENDLKQLRDTYLGMEQQRMMSDASLQSMISRMSLSLSLCIYIYIYCYQIYIVISLSYFT